MNQTENQGLKDLITKNVFFSVASQIFYMVARLGIPPLTLSIVSMEEYGLWAACFVIISWLGMGVSGIAQTYIRYVPIYYQRNDMDSINRLVSTGMTLSSLVGFVVIFGMWFAIPWVETALHVPEHLRDTGFVLFYGTTCIFMVELSWGSFAYILTGLQRMVIQKLIWVVSFCLEIVLIIVFLYSDMGIKSLLWAFCIRYIFSIGANIFFCYRLLPGLHIRFGHMDREFLRQIVHFGGITQVIGILNMIMGTIARVLAGLFLNLRAVAIFDLGQKFPRMAINIPGSLSEAIFPATAHLDSQSSYEEIGKLYLRGSRYINLIAGVILAFLATFSTELIGAWLGAGKDVEQAEDFSKAAILMMLYCLPWHWHTTTGPASAVFKGMGNPKREAVYPIVRGCFVVVCMSVAYTINQSWTVMGIGTAVASAIVCSSFLYMLYANRKLAVSQWLFIRKVLLSSLSFYLVGGLLAYASHQWVTAVGRWQLILLIGVAGVIYTLICIGLIYFVFADGEERIYFRDQARKILGRFIPSK